jgi:hypothetical protein
MYGRKRTFGQFCFVFLSLFLSYIIYPIYLSSRPLLNSLIRDFTSHETAMYFMLSMRLYFNDIIILISSLLTNIKSILLNSCVLKLEKSRKHEKERYSRWNVVYLQLTFNKDSKIFQYSFSQCILRFSHKSIFNITAIALLINMQSIQERKR